MKTLGEFIVEKQHEFSHATGELTALLSAIKLGAKIIHRDINKAGLVDILGASGAENVQGEVQQKLDLFANEKLKAALKARDIVAGIASEEEDEIVVFEGCEHAKYVVLMDPWMARPTSMLTSLSVPFSPSTAALRLLARR
ncbi:hypothetical protein MUTS16_17370 [Escherichia coli]|nr:hypothetical protein MUTS16_17370 [Escherichia coli]